MLTLERLRLVQGSFVLSADLTVSKGSHVAIIGPSGAGKSTLLAAIGGFLTPASGAVLWQGRDITHEAPGQRPVTTLFQDGNLFPHLTAAQNIGLGIRPSLSLNDAERANVAAVAERVGLKGLGDRKPGALSGGQQARVALARALIAARPILCLDEAFGALGPALKVEMLDLLAEVLTETQATLLMVTHDPEDARRIASQSILVADGVAHPPATTSELLDNPPPALQGYLGA